MGNNNSRKKDNKTLMTDAQQKLQVELIQNDLLIKTQTLTFK